MELDDVLYETYFKENPMTLSPRKKTKPKTAVRRYERKKPTEAKLVVEVKKPAPKKKDKPYLPSQRDLLDIVKRHLQDTSPHRYNFETPESKRLDALAEKRKKLLLKDTQYQSLRSNSLKLQQAEKRRHRQKRDIKTDLLNRIRLKGVTPAIVERVYKLLGLDKEEVRTSEE